MPEGEARWIPDPTRRHELRWWNGTRWTERVRDQGIDGEDWGPQGPPARRPQRVAPAPQPRREPPAREPEPRGLLEESPRRQHERARRRAILSIVAAVVILVAAIAIAIVVTSDSSAGGLSAPSGPVIR